MANQYPLAGLSAYNASVDAENWTIAQYGSDADDWAGNAFKHGTWNCQGVRKMIFNGYSKWQSLDLMRQFASAHEKDVNGNYDATSRSICITTLFLENTWNRILLLLLQ